ncbi:MAG: RodZ domain-containing protein [Paracoccaceae bacterium]
MIGRKSDSKEVKEDVGPRSFDDFKLRLGDVMRGERATLGKSLLDVQRELRIKASYIAAIENCDPDAFDTPGFIAGYVRSYARYLNMDPDKAFGAFCAESGFEVAHGMSAQASVIKKASRDDGLAGREGKKDIFSSPATPFVPTGEAFLSRVEPGAIGSSLVLLALIGGIGFGGWSILQEVQRVQVGPVEQTPAVLTDLDPIDSAVTRNQGGVSSQTGAQPEIVTGTQSDALDRLYRPQALDVPVLVARDAPIATLDPRSVGNFAQSEDDAVLREETLTAQLDRKPQDALTVPQVVEDSAVALRMVAVRDSWVRVRAADGTVIFEKVMLPGETWEAPLTEEAATLRTGNSGGIYFAMGDKFYGPVGPSGAVTSGLALSIAGLQESYNPVEIGSDEGLIRYAEAQATDASAD